MAQRKVSCEVYTDRGIVGPKGDDGAPNSLSIGTVEGGETASATITGEAPNQTLNLVIPKGDKGDNGQDGEPGQDGVDGVGISNISKTSTSGLVDTYTITMTDGNTVNFDVTNGKDGIDGQDGTDGTDGQDGFSPSATVSKSGKVTTITVTDKNGTTTATINDGEVSEDELNSALALKQDTLVSGTNIKTVNGNSLLGSGNVDIELPDNVFTADNLLPGNNINFRASNLEVIASNFGSAAGIRTINPFNWGTSSTEIVTKFSRTGTAPGGSGNVAYIFDAGSFGIGLDGGSTNIFRWYYVSGGAQWTNVNYELQTDRIYYLKARITPSEIIFSISSDGISYDLLTSTNNSHSYSSQGNLYLGAPSWGGPEYFPGKIWLSDTKVYGNDELILDLADSSNYYKTSDSVIIENILGENVYIDAIDPLPSQTGQSGKFLTTDGTDASWSNVDALPSQTGQSGKFLTTDGSAASWADIPTEVDNQSVTLNSNDQIQAVGVIDQNTSNANKFWTGTKAEYDAIVTKDQNTTYRTTDEEDDAGGGSGGGGADTSLSNLTAAGKEVAATMSMPSSVKVTLSTAGSSGSEYTAPADGYFYIITLAGNSTTLRITTPNLGTGGGVPNSNYGDRFFLPVAKGDVMKLEDSNGNLLRIDKLYFVYAKGSEPQQ